MEQMEEFENQQPGITPEPIEPEQDPVLPQAGPETPREDTVFPEEPQEDRHTEEEIQREPEAVPGLPKRKKKTLWTVLGIVALVVCCSVLTGLGVYCVLEENQGITNARFEQQIQALQQMNGNHQGLPGQPGGVLPGGAMTPAEIYNTCVSSVVAISRQTTAYDGTMTEAGSGSGFILTEDGYIVSNHHVVEGAKSLVVTTNTGMKYEAKLIASDASSDVALLKVEAEGLPAVTIGSSDSLLVGEQVVAIGNPLGKLTATQTVGYISGKDRAVSTDGTVISMLQTDAAINPGNSGGPLFNMYGQVVGITTAKYSGTTSSGATIEGIGFAIPIDAVIGMVEDMKDFGYVTGGYLGVTVSNMIPQAAAANDLPMGAYVREVTPEAVRQKAGVQPEDILVELGGYPIETLNDLSRALRNFRAGDTVVITVYRQGETLDLMGVLDEKPVTKPEAIPRNGE